MTWTPERIERLKVLWIEGKSCAQIAKQLGDTTRNAVIGKVNRLGLTGRRAAYAPGRPKAEAKPRNPRNQSSRQTPITIVPLPTLQGQAIQSEPRPWLTRAFGECAYPVSGDGADTMSCCSPTGDGGGVSPYCPAHRRLMYAKAATPAQIAAAKRMREAKRKAMARAA